MKKDIFLLDMDDTLFDFKRCEEKNLIDTLAQFGIVADEVVLQRFRTINKALWEQLERGEVTKDEVKVGRFERLFKEFGFKADARAAAAAYFKNFEEICFPFDGAENFLRSLKEHGQIYIVTNGGTNIQKRHILDAGFQPMISAMFISDEIGYNKPSNGFLQHVLRNIENFNKKRAVWIGDSLTSDYECAKLGGIDFILFAPEGAPLNYGGTSAKNYAEILELLNI